MSTLEKVEIIAQEKTSYGRLARYLLVQEDIRKVKIKVIMQDCKVSVATATRLAKRCETKGFKELRDQVYYEKKLQNNEESTGVSILEYSKTINYVIKNTLSLANERKIDEIVKIIHRIDKIDFFAVRGKSSIVENFAQKLDYFSKYVTYYTDFHMQNLQAQRSSEKTLSIGVSYSGTSKDTLSCLKTAHKNGAKTVLITEELNVKLYDYVDYVITVEGIKRDLKQYIMLPHITILVILDIIYNKLIATDKVYYEELIDKYNKNNRI